MTGQDWMEKDFYAVLGVPKDADDATIKKAYRKLARQHHPDQNQGNAAAESRFKEIGEAYAVLSDPEQRRQYDAVRAMAGARASRRGRAVPGPAASRTSWAPCSVAVAGADPGSATRRALRAARASRTSSARCSAVARAGRATGPPGSRPRAREPTSPRR
nr:hypothetical protein GCM10025730_35030 [Promicromonospora thailandica]